MLINYLSKNVYNEIHIYLISIYISMSLYKLLNNNIRTITIYLTYLQDKTYDKSSLDLHEAASFFIDMWPRT